MEVLPRVDGGLEVAGPVGGLGPQLEGGRAAVGAELVEALERGLPPAPGQRHLDLGQRVGVAHRASPPGPGRPRPTANDSPMTSTLAL